MSCNYYLYRQTNYLGSDKLFVIVLNRVKPSAKLSKEKQFHASTAEPMKQQTSY